MFGLVQPPKVSKSEKDGELSDSDSVNSEAYVTASDDEQGDGIKMFLQKNGKCFALQKCGNGITFTPRPKLAGNPSDGLYLRIGSGVYNGQGLILGSKSPFKNIPILGWLL